MASLTTHSLSMLFNIVVRSLTIFFALLFMPLVYAGQATLAWDANPDPAVAGYMVYSGEASGTYTSKVDAGNKTGATISGLRDGVIYYHAVTAYDNSRAESGFSAEVSAAAKAGGVVSPSAGQAGGGSGGGCAMIASTEPDMTLVLLGLGAVSHLLVRRKKKLSEAQKDWIVQAA